MATPGSSSSKDSKTSDQCRNVTKGQTQATNRPPSLHEVQTASWGTARYDGRWRTQVRMRGMSNMETLQNEPFSLSTDHEQLRRLQQSGSLPPATRTDTNSQREAPPSVKDRTISLSLALSSLILLRSHSPSSSLACSTTFLVLVCNAEWTLM